MTVVTFGNQNPQMQVEQDDGSTISVAAPHLNQSVTRIEYWDGFDDPDFATLSLSTDNDPLLYLIGQFLGDDSKQYAVGVNEFLKILDVHAASVKPAWVASDDSALQAVLADWFGCPQGDPSMLLTNVGRDALHAQHLSGTQPAAFAYIGLTASTTTPSATDTTLTGEITTAGGGLIRVSATYAHTTGTNTSTLTKTFTANGSDSLPVVLAQIGVFNVSTGTPTMGYHTALSATATLSAIGDSVAVTETITGG